MELGSWMALLFTQNKMDGMAATEESIELLFTQHNLTPILHVHQQEDFGALKIMLSLGNV